MRRLATCDRHRPAPRLTWQSGQGAARERPVPIRVRIYAARGAAFTLSGVNGTERRRTPVASNTAFEIADGTKAAAGSPAPHGGMVGRSIKSMDELAAAAGADPVDFRLKYLDAADKRGIECLNRVVQLPVMHWLSVLSPRRAGSL